MAKLCGRSLEWVESRAGVPGSPSLLPGVLARHSDGHQWVRRADIPDWIKAAEAEDVQRSAHAPAAEAYVKLPPLKVTSGPKPHVDSVPLW